jgi:hypothetical protein
MTEHPVPDTSGDGSVLLHQIVVQAILDEDGDQAIKVVYNQDVGISQALGLLEYAKFSLVEAFNASHGGA